MLLKKWLPKVQSSFTKNLEPNFLTSPISLFPSKPISLLEQELTILKNTEGGDSQKSGSKSPPTSTSDTGPGGKGKGKGGADEFLDNILYPSDSAVLREEVAPLDEGFVKSFLSGELCLRGVRLLLVQS